MDLTKQLQYRFITPVQMYPFGHTQTVLSKQQMNNIEKRILQFLNKSVSSHKMCLCCCNYSIDFCSVFVFFCWFLMWWKENKPKNDIISAIEWILLNDIFYTKWHFLILKMKCIGTVSFSFFDKFAVFEFTKCCWKSLKQPQLCQSVHKFQAN